MHRHRIRPTQDTPVIEGLARQLAAPLMLGDAAIDQYSYYEEGDVLYLTAGPPRVAAETDESLEGHAVFLDPDGSLIGVTVIGAREAIERDGMLKVTLPDGPAARYSRNTIEPLLVETPLY